MKKLFYLAVVLTVMANINTFSVTKKSTTKNSSSVKNQPEAVKVALDTVNALLKRTTLIDDSVDHNLTDMETQNWIYNNPRFTDDFKTEYSKYVVASNMNVCYEEFDEIGECRDFDDLEDEEKEFYNKYWTHPFGQGQDIPTGFKLVRYNEKNGYVIVKPKSGDHWYKYLMYIKVINEDGQWKVDGAGRINIPKQFHVPR